MLISLDGTFAALHGLGRTRVDDELSSNFGRFVVFVGEIDAASVRRRFQASCSVACLRFGFVRTGSAWD